MGLMGEAEFCKSESLLNMLGECKFWTETKVLSKLVMFGETVNQKNSSQETYEIIKIKCEL